METDKSELCGWCGLTPCDWKRYSTDLWLTLGRAQPRLRRRRNRTIRQLLTRYYPYLKKGNFQGCVPSCVQKKLLEYWPDKKVKATGSADVARQIASNASRS